MSSVNPVNEGYKRGEMKYKAERRKQAIASMVLGVLLTISFTAFLTILIIHLKGYDTKEQKEDVDKDIHEVIDGGWSLWGDWSSCSKFCGDGSKSRSRNCDNPSPQDGGADCSGTSEESSGCNTQECTEIDGGWSAWGDWSSCTKSCGSGSKSRRSCDNSSPQDGGADCSGSSVESSSCNTQSCTGGMLGKRRGRKAFDDLV